MTTPETTTEKEVKTKKVLLTPEEKADKLAAMTTEERAKYDALLERLAIARDVKNNKNKKSEETSSRSRYHY